MKKAFSMIELVFIIVLLGILAKIGSGFIPDNRLLNDTHLIAMKIKEAQKNALGYDPFKFGDAKIWDINRSDFNKTCVACSKNFFEKQDANTTLSLESITCTVSSFCFDSFGRPYELNGAVEHLIQKPIELNISYHQKTNTISVLPMSGYAIIK